VSTKSGELQLEYGDERTDKYGRLLCYVWTDDTLFVNLEIIKQGYGMAYLRFPHKWEDTFLQTEINARRQAIGMWASPRSQLPTQEVKQQSNEEKSIKIDYSKYSKKTQEVQQKPNEEASQEIVYITKSGSKYHRQGCRYLSKSMIPISLKEAKERGYLPCKVCKPPK